MVIAVDGTQFIIRKPKFGTGKLVGLFLVLIYLVLEINDIIPNCVTCYHSKKAIAQFVPISAAPETSNIQMQYTVKCKFDNVDFSSIQFEFAVHERQCPWQMQSVDKCNTMHKIKKRLYILYTMHACNSIR